MKSKIILVPIILSITGCISFLSYNSREDYYSKQITPMINRSTKSDVVQSMGSPYRRYVQISGESFYYWGFVSGGSIYISNKDERDGSKEYDYLTLNFDSSDTLRTWDVSIFVGTK